MEPQTITASRLKIAGWLAISLGFVAIGLFMIEDAKSTRDVVTAWFCVGLFGLGVVVFIQQLIRPTRLALDAEGFTLSGGLSRSSRQVQWRDIEPFYVYVLPRGGKMIGYVYSPGRKPDTLGRKVSRALGADGALPKSWPGSPEKMVDLLNDYRARALGSGAGPRFTAPAFQPDPIVR